MSIFKFDRKNYRKHGTKNKQLISRSLQDCGAGRSIVVDKSGEIIAGNGIYEQAQKLKMPVKVIETDGTELIAVREPTSHLMTRNASSWQSLMLYCSAGKTLRA